MPKKAPSKSDNGLFSNILWMMVGLSMLGIMAVYALNYFEDKVNQPVSNDSSTVKFTIAASPLHAPQTWAKTPVSSDQTALNAMDLEIPLTIGDASIIVGVTLLPSSKAAPSAYLLDTLYIHKFDESASQQAFGLVIKKLKDEEGFEGEVIYYDALSASPFVAKCLVEKGSRDSGNNCITTRLVNKRVSALIRFNQNLLPSWRAFATAIDNKLSQLKHGS